MRSNDFDGTFFSFTAQVEKRRDGSAFCATRKVWLLGLVRSVLNCCLSCLYIDYRKAR